jgi:peroxiredoxin
MSLITTRFSVIKKLALFTLLPTIILLTTSIISAGKDGLKIGKKLPLSSEKMPGTDGEQYSLNELAGENGIILVFSCNTCPFVIGRENFEGWEKQYNTLSDLATTKGIRFVLINSNEGKRNGVDSMEKMKQHATNANYTMPYLMDANNKLADACGAKTTPHVFMFDSRERLVYKGSIDNSWDTKRASLEKYLEIAIENLAQKKKIKDNSTPPRGCSIKRKNK